MSTATPRAQSKSTTRADRLSGARIQPAEKSQLDAAFLISTYQRPSHLRRALLSVELQQGVAGRFELVVTDDGSQDETADLVSAFAERVDFPVHFTTHQHEAFQLARCRNEGVRATTAPYLLFLDGDLVMPPDFLKQHLAHQAQGFALAGDSCYFPEETSAQVDEDAIRAGKFLDWIPPTESRRLAKKAFRAKIYNLLRHKTRPSFKGGNIAIWREDYERVNGYDENFVGWGLEETDLQWRLARHGVRFRSSMGWTCTCHMWHPPSTSFVPRARGTDNESYMKQPGRLSVCRHGLFRRTLEDLAITLTGACDSPMASKLLQGRIRSTTSRPEVEIHFAQTSGHFSEGAECNILVAQDPKALTGKLLEQAHFVVSDHPPAAVPSKNHFRLDQFDETLASIV